jgi:hypothetical protein
MRAAAERRLPPAGGTPLLVGTALGVLLGALLAGPSLADPSVRAEVRRALLPLAAEHDLDAGAIELDAARGHFALSIDVSVPEDEPPGWALFLRADRPTFVDEGTGKACSDLEWKLDEAPSADYRGVDENETVVLADSEGRNARIALDVRVRVGWLTESGAYDLGLLFRVAPY